MRPIHIMRLLFPCWRFFHVSLGRDLSIFWFNFVIGRVMQWSKEGEGQKQRASSKDYIEASLVGKIVIVSVLVISIDSIAVISIVVITITFLIQIIMRWWRLQKVRVKGKSASGKGLKLEKGFSWHWKRALADTGWLSEMSRDLFSRSRCRCWQSKPWSSSKVF